jgi:hypothetical protein
MSSQSIPTSQHGLYTTLFDQFQKSASRQVGSAKLEYPTFGTPMQTPNIQYFFNAPISIYASVVATLSTDVKHLAERFNRHEELLQEIVETVRVIEVETRKLGPDAIHDATDAAESDLNDILHTIRERRFPSSPSEEIDALLSKAIEIKTSLAPSQSLAKD